MSSATFRNPRQTLQHVLLHPPHVLGGVGVKVFHRAAAAKRGTHFVGRDAVEASFFQAGEERLEIDKPRQTGSTEFASLVQLASESGCVASRFKPAIVFPIRSYSTFLSRSSCDVAGT
jgi:hypothetical protein